MWDLGSEETPPVSPLWVKPATPRRPLLRDERSSSYYKRVQADSNAREVAEAAELEYGWGGNAGAFRSHAFNDLPPLALSDNANVKTLGTSAIHALVDPEDLDFAVLVIDETSDKAPSRNSFARLLRMLCCSSRVRSDSRSKSSQKRASARQQRSREAMLQESRALRDELLSKRQARGSIMYEKDSGIARIPLYAAPGSGTGAAALSSFAPLPPLGAKASQLGTKGEVAKASATINRDGRLVEIKKQTGFNKANNRYSAFVRSS